MVPTRSSNCSAVIVPTGVGMKLDEPALAYMEGLWKNRGRPMPENNRKQAMLPESADVLTAEHQRVFLPNPLAGCPMADMAEMADGLAAWE